MMKSKNLLLVIDMQNDFCEKSGALYVDGAEKDVENLSRFVYANAAYLDKIILTQDTHHVLDISHPAFWVTNNDAHPVPFTPITLRDIEIGAWQPICSKTKAATYIKKLETNGEYPHIIWPEHCIAGSEGAAINPIVMQAVKQWARQGKYFEIIQKGLNPLTEHFGALRANIPIDGDSSTQLNKNLIKTMQEYDKIIIAGEAKSHCVANTIKQMFDVEGLTKKMVILDDTMSNVKGFEKLAMPVYAKAEEFGAIITTTKNYTLK